MRISDWSSDVCSSDLGVLFGLFAAINYWWPKAFGYKLDVFWGKVSFWCWVVGFWVAFTPLYILGLMGVTRRMRVRSEEHTSELQSLMRISYAVFCLKKKNIELTRAKDIHNDSFN